jgi:hypothetical protein
MKLTKAKFRLVGIYNSFLVSTVKDTENGNPYVAYSTPTTGLGSRSGRWTINRPGYKTDSKEGHWTDNYNKTFSCFGREDKELRRIEAIAWASQRYGISNSDWEKDPFGAYHPKEVLERVKLLMTKEQMS